MYLERQKIYKQIEKERNSKVIAYVTSDRRGLGAQILTDAIDVFAEHLDAIGNTNRISLLLYTLGGDTLAAWNIINLIREFCNELEIIVPNKCRSAGTLMALGANTIVMTKQATLGPIDPSLNSPLNPIIPNSSPPQKIPVSVESVKGYFDMLKNEIGESNTNCLSEAYIKLTDTINPLVLGDIYRRKNQITMLATKLLSMHNMKESDTSKIISFLCSDSGSHDYTISRTEARELGLNVESPSNDLYSSLKKWYNNIVDELKIRQPFIPQIELPNGTTEKAYEYKRALIESVARGEDAYVSEGILIKNKIPTNPFQVHFENDCLSEGWRYYGKSRRKSNI